MKRNVLLFLDIDGTLLDASYASNDSTLPATIATLADQGYTFGLNSNRSIEDMLPIAKAFRIEGPVIGENGVFAYYPGTKKTEYLLNRSELAQLQAQKQRLEATILDCLIKSSQSTVHWRDVDTVAAISNGSDTHQYADGDIVILNNKFRKYTTSAHIYMCKKGTLTTVPTSRIQTVLTLTKHEFSDADYTITYDKKFSNILGYSSDVSKRSAIEKLLSQYPNYDLYSIGDDVNDYLMTKDIGRFMTIGNASQQVQAKAQFVATAQFAAGVNELLQVIQELPDQEDICTEQQLEALGFSEVRPLQAGETTAMLYRAQNKQHDKLIIKLGSSYGDNAEILANQIGYEGIRKAGGEALLPKPIAYDKLGQRLMILMPDLGPSITVADQTNTMRAVDYTAFFDKLLAAVSNTVRSSPRQDNAQWLTVVLDHTISWLDRSREASILSTHIPSNLTDLRDSVATQKLVSDKASLMLLDFTPDNAFFQNGNVSFIDPWDQPTYSGSFVPSLAQFMTLASDIIALQGAQAATAAYEASLAQIGKLLALTSKQLTAQICLGKALQYSLSGFARTVHNPAAAQEHAKRAIQELHMCATISKSIK